MERIGWRLGNVARHTSLEDRLNLAVELHRALERATPHGIAAGDAEGRLVYVNPAFCEMVGWTEDDLLGVTPPFPFWPPEHVDAIQQAVIETLEGRAPHDGYEFEFMRRSGERFHVQVRLGRAELPGGQAVFVGSITDVDERHRAAQALRQSEMIYRAIGESIDYGIWINDAQGHNVYASPSFLELVGITQEQCSKYGWGDVLHPDEAQETLEAWKACVRTGGFWEREHRYRGRDGRWHWVLARGVPIKGEDGEILCWAGINLDIQALKEAERVLRESDARKDEFIAVLAHELRNPLAPLTTSLELLAEDPSSDVIGSVLPVMQRQVANMARIVDDLNEANRFNRGAIELQLVAVELAQLVRSAVDTVTPAIKRRGHTLELALPAHPIQFEGDAVRLTQALSNILDNAAKYTPSGGRIEVEALEEHTAAGTDVVVRVRDDGLGVDPDELDSMFQMFTRLESREARGLGIGLSLVRSIADLHGGRVQAFSEGKGRGLEVELRLPARAHPRRTVQSLHDMEGQSRRMLVVDDDRDAADTLSALLAHKGHVVQKAYDGEAALQRLREEDFGVALIDLDMPGMGGLEVAAAVRQRPELRALVLVATTGWGRPEDRKRALAAGFDVHLTKPVQMTELSKALDALERRRGR